MELNFNKGAMIVSGIKQLFKAKEAIHLHGKQINVKRKIIQKLMNPTHIEDQIQVEIQAE
jgi:hypothetical protein